MSDIFISYARSTEAAAQLVAEALRALGYGVWRDDQLPAHRPYAEVIEERLRAAKAVVVLWSAEGVRSQWVRAEADLARHAGTLVQLTLDNTPLPLPFDQVQCVDLAGWNGDGTAPGWRKVVASVAELLGRKPRLAASPAHSQHAALHGGRAVVGVPPINDHGEDAGDHFADGLRDDLVAALSRHTMLQILQPSKDHDRAAAEDVVGADYVVEAQVRRSGERLRVSARLVSARDGDQIWSERYDGISGDIFGLQDRVTEGVAASVEANVRRHRILHAAAGATASLDNEERFLKAAMHINRLEKAGYFEGLALLDTVIAANPRHPHALAMAALAHFNIWVNGYAEGSDANRDQGIAMARRALAISDTDAFSTGLAALTLAHLGEPVAASQALIDRIIKLNPNFPPAWLWSGQVRLIAGDLDGALDCLATANRLDPRMTVRPVLLATIGAALMLQQRFDEASATLNEAAQLASEMPLANLFLASCYGHLGYRDGARAKLAAAAAVAPAENYRLPLCHPAHRAFFETGLALARADRADRTTP